MSIKADPYTFFSRIPWCAKLLKDPRFSKLDEDPNAPINHSVFWSATLSSATGNSIRNELLLHQTSSESDFVKIPESRHFIEIGVGASGQTGICHGGFNASVLDQATGELVGSCGLAGKLQPYTISLNVTYVKPVKAPGVVVVISRIVKVEGRKIFLEASIEDGIGVDTICAKATALYIRKRESL